MIRWEEVKSVGGVAEGSGNLSRKLVASGHWGTGRKGGTGKEGVRGGAGGMDPDFFVGDDTGVRLGEEGVC